MAQTEQFCTFYLDGHFFGVPVQQVQEVIRYQEMTRVPLVPLVIRGLINLRGQIVTAIDLRRRLGMTERPAGQRPMNVVVRTVDGALSLLVDEIGDVIEVEEKTFEQQFRPGRERVLNGDADRIGIFRIEVNCCISADLVQRRTPRGGHRAAASLGLDDGPTKALLQGGENHQGGQRIQSS